MAVASNFNPPREDEIPHVDLTRDVNHDGRDDLVVPDVDGCTVFTPGGDIAFQSDDRIQLGMERRDFDRDGQVDLMLTTIEVRFLESSLWKRIKGAMRCRV